MLRIGDGPWLGRGSAGMADREEAGAAAGLCLVGVDRHAVVVAAAGMGHVIGAAADRSVIPRVVDVEYQRYMHADCRMQRVGRLPGAVAHPGDVLARSAGG